MGGLNMNSNILGRNLTLSRILKCNNCGCVFYLNPADPQQKLDNDVEALFGRCKCPECKQVNYVKEMSKQLNDERFVDLGLSSDTLWAKIKFKGIYCTVEKERIVKENYTISDIRRGLAIPKLKGIDVATIDQYQELLDECTFQLVASGIRFYGPNEETITFKYNIRDLPGYFNYYVKSPNIVDKAFVFTNRGKNGEMNKPHIEAVELDYKYPVGIQLIKVKK